MAQKSSSSSSSGIDKALEGEPIITWTCAVLKECLRSQGGRLTRKKNTSFGGRSFTWWRLAGWSVISTESLPRLVFTELSSVTKTPRLQRHWKSSVPGRSEADDKTLNEVRRQRSLGCTDWVTLWWCTFCPSAFRLVNFMRNFFRGSVAISNKKKLPQFLLKKTRLLLWMSNNNYVWL